MFQSFDEVKSRTVFAVALIVTLIALTQFETKLPLSTDRGSLALYKKESSPLSKLSKLPTLEIEHSNSQNSNKEHPHAAHKLSSAQLISLLSLFESYRNAFIDKNEEIYRQFNKDPELPSKILEFLKHPPREDWIKHRMSGVDVLESVAFSLDYPEPMRLQAQGALMAVIALPLPPTLKLEKKRIMVAEKYDALAALGRGHPERALQVFHSIESPKLKEVLRPALGTLSGRGS